MKIKYRRDLWQLFKDKPGNVAEIGVAEGRFSFDILNWFPTLHLYMVDRWQCIPTQKGDAANSQAWHEKNLRDAIERVERITREEGVQRYTILQGDSAEMAHKVEDGSLALLYIDADHSYEGVMADLTNWHKKVRDGGFVALHDYQNRNYGVKEATKNFCLLAGYTVHEIDEDKPEDAGAWFQVIRR